MGEPPKQHKSARGCPVLPVDGQERHGTQKPSESCPERKTPRAPDRTTSTARIAREGSRCYHDDRSATGSGTSQHHSDNQCTPRGHLARSDRRCTELSITGPSRQLSRAQTPEAIAIRWKGLR